MPRSNRPRRAGRRAPGPGRPVPPGDGEDGDLAGTGAGFGIELGGARLEQQPDGYWAVRAVSGARATKTYRCPGCDHEILPGTPHLVAWPAEPAVGAFGGPLDRRHWHGPCWAARTRRPRLR